VFDPAKLGLAIPHDIWANQPIGIVAVEGGIVLYSVGRNGRDEGGGEEGDDFTFCLGRAFADRRLFEEPLRPE
jgi:hypothetical protein